MPRTEHEFTFEFPYMIAGGEAALFECRVKFTVTPGLRPIYHPWPGDPGHGPEIEEVYGVEVDIGKYDAKAGKWTHEWAVPDPALAQKIYDHLNTRHADMFEIYDMDKAA